ncbi:hypothetical protein [Arthrobacter bambusae]|uniref:Uncharacterized protein n=1 Tax=Arthrobacter bambusae TaxID=1338426 RepID=A0AAW8D8V1_9MICC|nr:hypothetical protein [Arthrobacter bambusae]MDP9904702.1 hypothetical protein [Arthrobacter bambusae]MDQ0129518.1 hypothetical protein [Arthrobacter bambusae]MDQ0180869.1 hypothetical protein [Arthrobacter bambusae]
MAFGTSLVVDWLALLWVFRRIDLHAPGGLENAARPLIWGGLALLMASGSFLHPDLSKPTTVVKLLCVLVLTINGLLIVPVIHSLAALPDSRSFRGLNRRLRTRLFVALCI